MRDRRGLSFIHPLAAASTQYKKEANECCCLQFYYADTTEKSIAGGTQTVLVLLWGDLGEGIARDK